MFKDIFTQCSIRGLPSIWSHVYIKNEGILAYVYSIFEHIGCFIMIFKNLNSALQAAFKIILIFFPTMSEIIIFVYIWFNINAKGLWWSLKRHKRGGVRLEDWNTIWLPGLRTLDDTGFKITSINALQWRRGGWGFAPSLDHNNNVLKIFLL